MVKKQDPTWMVIAIIVMVLMLIFLVGWIISSNNSNAKDQSLQECENLKDYYRESFNKLSYCFENNLDECDFNEINEQYGYS